MVLDPDPAAGRAAPADELPGDPQQHVVGGVRDGEHQAVGRPRRPAEHVPGLTRDDDRQPVVRAVPDDAVQQVPAPATGHRLEGAHDGRHVVHREQARPGRA